MRRNWRTLTAGVVVVLLAVVLFGAVRVQTQAQCGGAFIPSLNCLISGQWFWTQASPFVFEGATANAFETTLAITDPTADRTITVPNASGTIALGAFETAAGTTTLDGSNPTSVSAATTGLSAITSCVIQQAVGVTPADDPIGFTWIGTASAGRLDIYAWKTNGTDPTWTASTDSTAIVGYICFGTP